MRPLRSRWRPTLAGVGILLLLALPRPTCGQEAGERDMSRAESQALESWARSLLTEHPASEEGGFGEVRSPAIQRLWALYFLSVDHQSRVDDARAAVGEALVTEREGEPAPIVRALSGAVEVARAKHSRWPPNKLKYLRAGIEALDDLVEDFPEAPGIRYLRLVSCFYLPFFLEREESVAEDLRDLPRLLAQGPGDLPEPVYLAAVEFLLDKGEYEEETRSLLRSLLG